ncbi:predicted protein [Naegleria gruberi]|uniref:Predicted protein n=1 Tax=Naegleria gruberi TaxID=5762 RepID=D2W5E8_NAEGR|nr:uncharacterized protein NAEGRDRAFT_82354 [Naegleria gruberi]EFC35704.1 predicted protein [Naegleria gruberi]|eukprot:XP_002668448.1 predicted protein [Naegleria gruberi strain NEG-M]
MITDVVSPTVTIHNNDNNNDDTKDDSNKQSTKPNVVSDSTITPNETSKKTGLTASSTVTTLDDMETKVILTNLKNASNVNYVETQNWKKGLKGIRRKKYTWTFLTVCGFVGGVIIYTHDLIVKYMFQGRLTLINAFDSNSYFGLRLVLWILFNLVFMYVSLMMTIFIAPASEGSGIPAIKAILNGTPLEDPLSFKTFLVKIITLPAVLGTGMFFGKVIIGAGCGRFFGEIVAIIFPNGFVAGQPIYAGAYAVVGIVALTASATHAFSTVFIFLEIVGVAVYLPSLMAALIAVRISRLCTANFYDTSIKVKGWPALLESMTDSEDLKVTNIMTSVDKLDILEENVSMRDLELLLQKKKLPKILPVVSSKDNLVLLGQVHLKSLEFQYNLMKARLNNSGKEITQASNFAPISDEGYGSANDGNDSSATNMAGYASFELQDRDETDIIRIEYETCDITISESQSAQRAHMLFSQLCLDEAFVVWKGRLMGQLARQMLINTVSARERNQIIVV